MKGLLYGTTEYGGMPRRPTEPSSGSVRPVPKKCFIDSTATIHDRTYNDGANPVASLIDVKGKLYGTTYSGGFNQFYGTVFRLSMSGNEKVLHSFSGYSTTARTRWRLVERKWHLVRNDRVWRSRSV